MEATTPYDTYSLIDIAVMSCNTFLVQLILNEGLYICQDTDDPNMTPIHWLARQWYCVGDYQRNILRMLQVQAGYNINGLNQGGLTPLHLACLSPVENLKMVKLLIEEGADVNAVSKNGDTPLSLACAAPKPTVMEYLLQYGADMSVNAKDTLDIVMDYSPIDQSPDTLKCLLSYGFDVNVIEEQKFLEYLATIPQQSRSRLFNLLLELGFQFHDHDAIFNIVGPSHVVQQPLSLQRICVNSIRKSLSPKMYINLMKLEEVPKCLKPYFMMKEF